MDLLTELFGPVHLKFKGSGQFLLLPCFIEMPVINANSVDPDQMPLSAASDLGLHCLPMSHLWDARHKWVLYVFQQAGLLPGSTLSDIHSAVLDKLQCRFWRIFIQSVYP